MLLCDQQLLGVVYPDVVKHNGNGRALQYEVVNDQVLVQECLDFLVYLLASTKHCNCC